MLIVSMAAVTSAVEFDDFDTICRLCLCAGDLKSLFDNSLDNVLQIFKELTSIQVAEGDTLPSNLCSNCLNDLIKLKSFVDRCISADKTLREIAKNAETDIKPELIEVFDIINEENKVVVVQPVTDECKNTSTSSEVELVLLKQEDVHECTICSKSFSNDTYSAHLLLHQTGIVDDSVLSDNVDMADPLGISEDDQITFDDLDDDNYEKYESTKESVVKTRKCDKCKEDVISLSYHYKIKKECKPQFKCTICDRTLTTKRALANHLRSHRSNDIALEQMLNKIKASKDKEENERPCEYCGDLITNIWRHSYLKKECTPRYKCPICDQEVSLRIKELHMRAHRIAKERAPRRSRKIQGDICMKSFPSKDSDKEFTSAYLKRYHEDTHHGETNKFICEQCGQTFKSRQTFRSHQLLNHQLDKQMNKCHICNKIYTSKLCLKQHLLVHTGDKPFLCSICGQRFRARSTLENHTNMHNNHKPHKCSYCDKSFAAYSCLAQHTLIHTGEKPFRCEICPREFKQRTHLVHHERIHTGEKPYRCDICDRAFAIRSNLTAHQRVHTGERFSCEICKRSFYDKKYLKKHVLKEH